MPQQSDLEMIFQKCSAFFGIDSKNVRLFSELIPKMFGFLYARCVGFATGIAILYCSQNKIESYPKAVYKTITPGNIEEFVL